MVNKIRNRTVSVIVPAYNEANNIEAVVDEIIKAVDGVTKRWEIIIVDDGSNDSTYAKAKKLEKYYGRRVKALSYGENKGKGFALKYGFEHSTGSLVAFIDADMDLHPRQIKKFLKIMEKTNADVIVGSKRHPESKVRYPAKRKILSFAYCTLIRTLFKLDVGDTQVGLKLFKRRVLEDIMPRILVKRYAFDVELLANAVRRGYRTVEAPVELSYNYDSRINWKAIWYMFVDTLAIAYRMYIKKYYDGYEDWSIRHRF